MVDRIPAAGDVGRSDAVGDEVADLLHAVNRRIRSGVHDSVDPAAVTPAQARALRIVLSAGCPMRMSEIADRLHIARRSATSVIDELVDRGLVVRRHDDGDRRAVMVEPTAAGREALERFAAKRRTATAGLVHALSPDDRLLLRDLLRRLVDTGPAGDQPGDQPS